MRKTHAERFAALAPVAGRPVALESVPFANAPATPESARQMAKIAGKSLKNFRFVEYPNDDHFVIGVTSMPSIFDFFDRHRPSPKP